MAAEGTEEFLHTLSIHYPELFLQIHRARGDGELPINTAKRIIRAHIHNWPPIVAEFILVTYLRIFGAEYLQNYDGVFRTLPEIRQLMHKMRNCADKRAGLFQAFDAIQF